MWLKWFLLPCQIPFWNNLNAAEQDLQKYPSYFESPISGSSRYKRLARHHPPHAKQRLCTGLHD